MNKLEQAALDLLEGVEAAIKAGDWKVDGACDPDIAMYRLREALASRCQTTTTEQAECKECGTKQAQIDRLMLEYCPEEMTAEQTQKWGSNQRPAEQAEQKPVGIVEGSGEWGIAGVLVAGVPIGTKLYAAPVRTKDLTDDEINQAFYSKNTGLINGIRAVIAADREKNK